MTAIRVRGVNAAPMPATIAADCGRGCLGDVRRNPLRNVPNRFAHCRVAVRKHQHLVARGQPH